VDGGWRYVVAGEGEKLQNRTVQMLMELKAH
jgi:hypothetical protein